MAERSFGFKKALFIGVTAAFLAPGATRRYRESRLLPMSSEGGYSPVSDPPPAPEAPQPQSAAPEAEPRRANHIGPQTPTGVCWCGCGGQASAGKFFLPGHDRTAQARVIRANYGDVATFLVAHGFDPNGHSAKPVADAEAL